MKKILIASYMFPPIGGGGTQRPLKFAKYLPSFGIEPIVFCPRVASWKAYDRSPLNQPYFRAIRVYRCGIRRLAHYYRLRYEQRRVKHPYYYLLVLKYFWFLDFFSAWYFECRENLLEIARKENVDCVLTTSPPHSIHLFGRFLKSELGLPWIMDIRDAMTADPNRPMGRFGCFQRAIEHYYERSFYRSADAVVVVSEPMKESIATRRLDMDIEKKIHVITNGFDEDDFSRIESKAGTRTKLTITYTGSYMGRQTPEYFLTALQTLVKEKKIEPGDLLIRFVGHFDSPTLALFQRYSNDLPIEIIGFQPYERCLYFQKNSDLLLLIVNISTAEGGSQTMTGKFFEYVGARRPIFALVPAGPLNNIIAEGRLGFTVAPKDVTAVAQKFKSIYDQWRFKGRIEFDPDSEIRAAFTRKRLTRKLATLVDSFDRTIR
jgi:glycosyltransferase involved in cell wall biosynthesis